MQVLVERLKKHMESYQLKKPTMKHVKIIASTYGVVVEAKEMIGDVCEVRSEYHHDDTLLVYTEDREDSCWFNKSDTIEAFPDFKIGEHVLCVGDVFEWETGGREHEIYDCMWYDGEMRLFTYYDRDRKFCTNWAKEELKKCTIVSAGKKESLSGKEVTLTVDGKDYKAKIQ